MILLGLDPGLAACGWATVEYNWAAMAVERIGTYRTTPSPAKLRISAAEDLVRRGLELASATDAAIVDLDAAGDQVIICAEAMSYPRSASAAAKMAIAWGIICAVASHHRTRIVLASPRQIRAAIGVPPGGGKREVQRALEKQLGAIDWPRRRADVEHAADALAAVVACVNLATVRDDAHH
jgi:Holliday junction resolvasome RuvABC endonuclease subunit